MSEVRCVPVVLILFLPLSSVSRSFSRLRQVSPQPGGGRDLLGTDRLVGQPQSPSDARPKDPPVCCSTHGKTLSNFRTHDEMDINKLRAAVGLLADPS